MQVGPLLVSLASGFTGKTVLDCCQLQIAACTCSLCCTAASPSWLCQKAALMAVALACRHYTAINEDAVSLQGWQQLWQSSADLWHHV